MSRGKRKSTGRDGQQFVALPFVVLDSPAYLGLPYPSCALLLELARQYTGSNNGKLVLCDKFLAPRNWKSADVINRAKAHLLESGLIQETRKGQRPNKASWYALTWQTLDWSPEMDIQRNGFERGAYLKNKKRPPAGGVEHMRIAPAGGVKGLPATPPDGAMQRDNMPSPTPLGGDYLDVAICTDDAGRDEMTGEFVPMPMNQTVQTQAWAADEMA
ncbi:MAG: hypothetical protein P4L87_10160 [Formivibrio sp.]|nr:hypothetical protein [Formivibrio sp.]